MNPYEVVVFGGKQTPGRAVARESVRPYTRAMSTRAATTRRRLGRWIAPVDLVDVLVYVVVLNLAIEYLPAVLTETFTLSLLTAVLLKGVLEVVVWIKDRGKARLKAATSPAGKGIAVLGLWAVLVGSKFVVLELVALLFGDRVVLGGFFAVTGVILVLMLARRGVRWLLNQPPGE